MFDNIGRKLMSLSRFLCYVGIASSVLSGIILMIAKAPFTGLLVALIGSLASWISSWVTYAIGEIAENTAVTRRILEYNGSAELHRAEMNSSFENTSNMQNTPDEFYNVEEPIAERTFEYKTCPHCGETVKSSICGMCGKRNVLFD